MTTIPRNKEAPESFWALLEKLRKSFEATMDAFDNLYGYSATARERKKEDEKRSGVKHG
jgi:hypothetical protein